MPVLRLVNIDTGAEKLQIAYRKGKQWRKVIAEKGVLASANKILELANVGVAVTSESAKHLVQYFYDLESLNYIESNTFRITIAVSSSSSRPQTSLTGASPPRNLFAFWLIVSHKY